MMQNKFLLIFIIANILISPIKANEIDIEKSIDLNKFSGLWLEIARPSNFSQKNCNYSAVNYEFTNEKELKMTNLCISKNNIRKKKSFNTSLIENNKDNRTLYVEYGGLTDLLKPLYDGNLYIFYVNDDYTLSIIGNPDKSHFWILSRNILSNKETKNMLVLAKSYGLNTDKLFLNNLKPKIIKEINELLNDSNN